ncbi:hypothetical protein FOZ60_014245 [Perkinsus olseni]|uniref:Rhodanese domain-containing protein n=1 Tax=Perkinsus olseni TaxID=32597 RepID=A0A7J6N885_PEROL|nr:hypothetical protein FOZ60_014245 [Perkinsus olseni]
MTIDFQGLLKQARADRQREKEDTTKASKIDYDNTGSSSSEKTMPVVLWDTRSAQEFNKSHIAGFNNVTSAQEAEMFMSSKHEYGLMDPRMQYEKLLILVLTDHNPTTSSSNMPEAVEFASHQLRAVGKIYLARGGYSDFRALFPILAVGTDEEASKPYAYGLYPVWCGDGILSGSILDGSNKALLKGMGVSWMLDLTPNGIEDANVVYDLHMPTFDLDMAAEFINLHSGKIGMVCGGDDSDRLMAEAVARMMTKMEGIWSGPSSTQWQLLEDFYERVASQRRSRSSSLSSTSLERRNSMQEMIVMLLPQVQFSPPSDDVKLIVEPTEVADISELIARAGSRLSVEDAAAILKAWRNLDINHFEKLIDVLKPCTTPEASQRYVLAALSLFALREYDHGRAIVISDHTRAVLRVLAGYWFEESPSEFEQGRVQVPLHTDQLPATVTDCIRPAAIILGALPEEE